MRVKWLMSEKLAEEMRGLGLTVRTVNIDSFGDYDGIMAELTGMTPLGFVYYGDNVTQRSYYNKKYYNKKYAYRKPDPS